jgi:RecA/RadA recombinase
MAKYDYGGGCPCGLYKECEPNCEHLRKDTTTYEKNKKDKKNMSLRNKILKNTTSEHTAILEDSKIYSKKDMITTSVPMINVALSGSIDGGLTPGVTMIAGPSKHFKTGFALLMASSFLRKYKDGVVLFYDSEFGTPQSYFKTFNIPLDSVVHTPITDVEELKHDLSVQLKELTRDDKVIIIIDSIGNLASRKETEDAEEGKAVADMTRARALKSFFRIITAKLTLKDIPMIVVNHTYKEIGLYPKDIVGGGCVVAGTKVKLANGTLKSIEDFVVGDFVQTLDGDKEVTAVWNPDTLVDGTPERIEVEFDDGYKVVVSENHRFLTTSGWVKASDLNNSHVFIDFNHTHLLDISAL